MSAGSRVTASARMPSPDGSTTSASTSRNGTSHSVPTTLQNTSFVSSTTRTASRRSYSITNVTLPVAGGNSHRTSPPLRPRCSTEVMATSGLDTRTFPMPPVLDDGMSRSAKVNSPTWKSKVMASRIR